MDRLREISQDIMTLVFMWFAILGIAGMTLLIVYVIFFVIFGEPCG